LPILTANSTARRYTMTLNECIGLNASIEMPFELATLEKE
jgi:hypothetical protein